MKFCKNGDFRHISGIFGRKKFSSKIGLGHVLDIAKTHLCVKNQKKLMMKSRENAKKPVFPAYFRNFQPENFFFWKSGCHILDIIILRQYAKFHEKISSTARDIQEILFFRRKLAVPAIFRQFRLQKSVILTIETCLMVGIAINNVFVFLILTNKETIDFLFPYSLGHWDRGVTAKNSKISLSHLL